MPDRLVGRLRWLWGGAAVLIATGGGLVLLLAPGVAPSATGAPDAGLASLFARALVAAGVATSVALATLIAWSPRRFAHLMPVCALAAGTAAATLLDAGFAAGDARALGGCAGALLLAAASAASWLALWLSPHPSHATVARDEELRAVLLEAIVPGASADRQDDGKRRAALVQTFRAAHRRGETLLRVVLRVVDLASRAAHGRGFAALDAQGRERFVADLARSRFTTLRRIGTKLETDVLARYYADPRVHEEIGFDAAWLRERIAAGPNRAGHLAREEAQLRARAAALAGEAAKAEAPDGGDVVPESAAGGAPAVPERREEVPAAGEDVPFDRAWTLGVAREPVARTLGPPVLQALRTTGPTRP